MDNKAHELSTALSIESILNNIGCYIYSKDLTGKYTYVNELVAQLLGAEQKAIIGKDDSHFFDLSISDELRQNDLKVMTEGVTVETTELIFVRAIGELRSCKCIKKPLFDNNNNIIGLTGISFELNEISDLKEVIEEQQQFLNTVLDNVDAYIYVKDSTRHFHYVNSKLAKLFALPIDQIIGKRDCELIPEVLADYFWASDKIVFETNERMTVEETITDVTGVVRHYISTKIPYVFQNNTQVLIGFSTDVTELYHLKESFQKQASIDSLTGLYNRRYFLESAEREFHRAQRHKLPFCIICIDIDHFKKINDTHGHLVGDEVLKMVANNLLLAIRSEDILARIGGEEFSILLPDTTPEKARVMAHRICLTQGDAALIGNWQGEINATISVGVTCIKASDNTFQELFSRSDKALYQAKDTGKNRVNFIH